jgi:DNA-binding transcriptional regulator YhcF (GntR family)
MKKADFKKIIFIDYQSATPKYRQLADSILNAIRTGKLHKDELLPSINELSFNFDISRDTAEKGYKHLKELGVLGSVPGKGFYIANADLDHSLKIFLLFNKLSAHKKIIYDALIAALPETAFVDFFVYNNDFSFFKKLIQNRKEDYTHYVIIPHFVEGDDETGAAEVINSMDKSKLVLLDKVITGVTGNYASVYENFEQDIYNALLEAKRILFKYHTIKIIFPAHSYFPKEIVHGFERFCSEYGFTHAVVHDIDQEEIKQGEVYINLMENDLVILVEKIIAQKLEIGTDIGVISYNETPLKRIILNGITTISTDFQLMGEKTAELILNRSSEHVEIPFYLTLRKSL